MTKLTDIDPFGAFPLEALLEVQAPPAPQGFESFWQSCYSSAVLVNPQARINDTGQTHKGWKILTVEFNSTDSITIRGWLLLPKFGLPKRGFIVGHGYGGRTEPDFHLPFKDAALFFPCFRGISLSTAPPISSDPNWHVLHDIDKKDRYILRGCVEDLWLSVSAVEQLFPYLEGKLGFLGISFAGGVGALALPNEKRIARAHFNVPTFGHHRLRLRLNTYGSGRAVQQFFKRHPRTTLNTLKFYDAANAAERITIPVHCALALKDGVVTPPGQFAIYNHLQTEKALYVLNEGHSVYKEKAKQDRELLKQLNTFFESMY